MTEYLEGKPVAEAIEQRVRQQIAAGAVSGGTPRLASVHLDLPSAFQHYLRQQVRVAEALGIQFRPEVVPSTATPEELLRRVRAVDADPDIHAILLEHPLPEGMDFLRAVSAIRPGKDVDGVSPLSLGRLVAGAPSFTPVVARAALEVARHYHVPLEGERVTVIGRSMTVGLPMALLLLVRGAGGNATVTVAHSRTRDLRPALAGASVIFSCVGHPDLLDRSNVDEGATVIDVGMSQVPDAQRPSGRRLVGDANRASLDGWAGRLTPTPGGVGPVTVIELMASTVEAWRRPREPGL